MKLELSLLLLKDTIRAVKEECYQMKREQKREFLRENREKLDIFNEFITNLLVIHYLFYSFTILGKSNEIKR